MNWLNSHNVMKKIKVMQERNKAKAKEEVKKESKKKGKSKKEEAKK